MNENNPIPPLIPPAESAQKFADRIAETLPPPPLQGLRPLGEDPAERVPITNAIAAIDSILRQPRRVMFQLFQPGAGKLIARMLWVALLCSAVYGLVAGTFSGGNQLWIAPAKIALGLMVSALIWLPSLYIFTCLSGSQARLIEVFGLLAGLLLLMTILLVGFAPVAWIFSQSTESLAWMGSLHIIFWFIATIFGLRFLEAGFTHTRARSQAGFHTWVIIFLLVAVQMTTALRPIIGTADTFLPKEKLFFLNHWGNCLKTPAAESNHSARD
jgi:hypothetical protein